MPPSSSSASHITRPIPGYRWECVLLLLLIYLASGAANAAMPVGSKLLIHDTPEQLLESILSGGPGKDGIPAIDQPHFIPASDATFLHDDDIVFGIYLDGQAKAYPQRILVWHEIVNDQVGDTPVSLTYCPLTATAIGFKRGENTLGVSGKLINSNVVMYDRNTDTMWSQIGNMALDGPSKGQRLAEFRVFWTTWAAWRGRHPDSLVLSDKTGFARNYRRDPYGTYSPVGGYYANAGTMFPTRYQDDRFHPKSMFFGFRTPEFAVAVEPEHLRNRGIVEHHYRGNVYHVLYDTQLDTAWAFRSEKGIEIDRHEILWTAAGPTWEGDDAFDPVNLFAVMWFAWIAFYPDTVVLVDGS